MESLNSALNRLGIRTQRELVDRVKEAAKETRTQDVPYKCRECGDKVGLEIQRLTKEYCADCFLELVCGIVPKQRGYPRY